MWKETEELWDCRFVNLLLESMADGVFTLDIKGRITSWNRSMEHISGYTAEEAIGSTCNILDFNRCFGNKCPTSIAECRIYRYGKIDAKECMLRHKDGSDVPVLKSARVVKNKKGS
ncbi:PAS domain S-box protein, partial [Desulfobacterales bacterium HSG16]|nr:PAS domain S-box protein [Desulfobacterales bacterium HSG16]